MFRNLGSAVLVMALVLGLAGIATAAPYELDGDQNLNGSPPMTFAGADPDLSASGGVYTLPTADRGLDMKGYALSTTNGTSISLNLNGGDIAGTAETSFDTRRADNTGSVTIQSVQNVSVGDIRTDLLSHSASNKTPGNISIGLSGTPALNITTGLLYAHAVSGAAGKGGSITLYGTGDVLVDGAIRTLSYVTTTANHAGSVTIGSTGVRAASITVNGAIDARVNAVERSTQTNSSNGGNVGLYAVGDIVVNGFVYTNNVRSPSRCGTINIDSSSGDILISGHVRSKDRPTTLTAPNGIISVGQFLVGNGNVSVAPEKYTYVQVFGYSKDVTGKLLTPLNKKVLVGGGGTTLTRLRNLADNGNGGWQVSNFGTAMVADNSNNPNAFGTQLNARVNTTVGIDGLFGRVATVSDTEGTGSGALFTTARILNGTITAQRDVKMSWRTRITGGLNPEAEPFGFDGVYLAALVSDVVNLTGTGGNTYVLEMTYDPQALSSLNFQDPTLWLAYYDSVDGWVNAGTGDNLGTYTNQLTVGNWGVDTVNHTAWAVLNHNSQFAVMAYYQPPVSEPTGLGLLGLALLGLRKRRN